MSEEKTTESGEVHETYWSQGKIIRCSHCDGTEYDKSIALLNTPVLRFLAQFLPNRIATTLHCKKCGLTQWFTKTLYREDGSPYGTEIDEKPIKFSPGVQKIIDKSPF